MGDRDLIKHENVGYPIGEQDFKELRKMDCIYVDKTMYIDKLIASRAKYYFLARPRRFGKSLFLSTLRYFFEGQRELFKDLYIDFTRWNWDSYPVLYLDLNTERYAEQNGLDDVLENLFRFWEEKYDVKLTSENLSQRFGNIIKGAHEKTGREVVILVDEYDKPLVSNLNKDDNFEYYRAKLASIYSNFKSSAEHIKFVFITGVSRFSKLSVFSDLNNIRDISFSDEFADLCGITEKELLSNFSVGIEKLAEKKRVSYEGACGLLKRNYDGYHFSPAGNDIYNPWSVLNALAESNIGSYWVYTGMPTIIAEALRNVDADLENILNTRCALDMLAGLDLKGADPLALLYQTGYLTIKKYQSKYDTVTLGVPNREVKKGLFDVLLPYYIKVKRGTPSSVIRDIINNIELGEPEKLIKSLDIFLAGIPYEMKMEDENNFHNAIYILLTLIGVNTDTEVHTSNGRIDLVIKSDEYIYIIELKYGKDSERALRQIEEKDYALPYLNDPRQIFCIGANFSSATRHLDNITLKSISKNP